MMPYLTTQQQQWRILLALSWWERTYTMPPTRREVAQLVGMSPTATNYHLNKLERAGRVTQKAGSGRTLRLVKPVVQVYAREGEMS